MTAATPNATAQSARFTLSAFGDEIADDLDQQLAVLRDLEVNFLELRGAWGKNVLDLNEDEVAQVARRCNAHGLAVSAIGSPIGKSPITDPIEKELDNLRRAVQIGEKLGTRRVRIFSFYPPDTSSNGQYDRYVDESARRLARLAALAEAEDFTLFLENEKAIVGDTPQRCHALLTKVASEHLRFAWDPANFVQVDVARPTDEGWSLLGPYVGYVHVKDAVLADKSVRPAGDGDGQVGELLEKLKGQGYQGFLALEPHLAIARHSSGFSGPEGMTHAVQKLRDLMAAHGCPEQKGI